MAKSYWQSVYVGDDRAKDAVKSWLGPICEGMTPYKADILCDVATEQEKKIRAFMTDPDNNHYRFDRTLGGRNFTISRKRLPARSAER